MGHDDAEAALLVFRAEWLRLARLQLTEPLLAIADARACEYGLRGYDSVHLAAALYWQDTPRERVTRAMFDRELLQARAGGPAGGVAGQPVG